MGRGGIVTAGRTIVWTGLLAGFGCSGGGGSGAGGGGTGGDDGPGVTLAVVEHRPLDGSLQVGLDAALEVRFDGVLVQDCLLDPRTRLCDDETDADVPGTISLDPDGKTLRFVPASPLREATDYSFHVSALTCDVDARLLEDDYRFGFRTLDRIPPWLRGSSVADGATGVDRTGSFTLSWNEDLDPGSVGPSTVSVRGAGGSVFACAVRTVGRDVVVDPRADLPGSRDLEIVADGVRDRSGNAAIPVTIRFTTLGDNVAPRLVESWPDGVAHPDVSPDAAPALWFDESVDTNSVESASLRLYDEFGELVDYRVSASPDLRTLRLLPTTSLVTGRSYFLDVLGGPGSLTDLSGNPLSQSHRILFAVGSDRDAPSVAAISPADGATRVSPNARLVVTFDEPIYGRGVDPESVELRGPNGPVDVRLALAERALTISPEVLLQPSTDYTAVLRRDHGGVRDAAGNPLRADVRVAFRTSDDPTPPTLWIWPADGSASVPLGAHVSVLCDAPLSPASVGDHSVQVTDDYGQRVPGSVTHIRGDRVIRFRPDGGFIGGVRYTVTLRGGGAGGVREASGNWTSDDLVSRFTIGHAPDLAAPDVAVTIDRIDALRNGDLAVPGDGFVIDVEAFDPEFSLDPTSIEVVLSGPAGAAIPDPEAIFASATVDGRRLSWRVPVAHRLTPGVWSLSATAADLSGNRRRSPVLALETVERTDDRTPFERTQVVWVRTDMDRDGNGRSDFLDDLFRLGFCTAGDPAGTNARMAKIVEDGILTRTHLLFQRSPSGGRRGADSVAVRLADRRPLGLRHMQIALGGMDPEGAAGRGYGGQTTGTLGRAFYDHRNGQIDDRDVGTRPGLGVFPGEMFLFETEVHRRVYPSFLTTFARRFINICPDMGGVSVGRDPVDRRILATDFDFDSATSVEQARYTSVLGAADDWATVIGTILAHEIGHSVGLVATGRHAGALHGDDSLHNEFSGVTDVMAATVGYESLVALDYSFRDLNLAYLRQRVLLK